MTTNTTDTVRGALSSRRLRDSCTACAQSKVRCGKEKPTCARCARRNFPCDYGVSRRTGRHPYVARSNSASGGSPQSGPPPGPWPGPGPGPEVRTTATSEDPISPTEESPVHVDAGPGPVGRASTAAGGGMFSSPHTPFTPTNHSPLASTMAGDMTLDLWDSLNPLNTDLDEFVAGIASPMIIDTSLDVIPLPAPESAPNLADCCLTLALDTLAHQFTNAAGLCQLPNAVRSDASHQVRTIDSVISKNAAAMATVSNMLECPCSEDEYVVILITMILFKVIAWYAAAASGDGNDLTDAPGAASSAKSASSSTSATSASSLSEHVMHFPTMVGNYCVDGQEKGRMAAQLVLSELHRVSGLVDKVSAKLHSRGNVHTTHHHHPHASSGTDGVVSGSNTWESRQGAPTATFEVQANPVAYQLEQDLRQRLRRISSSTIAILRHT